MGSYFEEMTEPITAENIDRKLRAGFSDSVEIVSGGVSPVDWEGPFPPGDLGHFIGGYALKIKDSNEPEGYRITADIFWLSGDTINGKQGYWEAETDESMGPAVYCSPEILQLLTPIRLENGKYISGGTVEARRWRAASAKHWAEFEGRDPARDPIYLDNLTAYCYYQPDSKAIIVSQMGDRISINDAREIWVKRKDDGETADIMLNIRESDPVKLGAYTLDRIPGIMDTLERETARWADILLLPAG